MHAKADGCDPSMLKEIANVFPNSFEVSDSGEIPKGWKATTIKDGIEIFNSKRIPLNKRKKWNW